jgi:DNA-binding MarR family transcriptional regulator
MTEKTMPRLRFEGSVWCNLDIALRNIDQIFRTCVQDLGLSVIEWYVLRALFIEDGQHASQLAHEVGRAATSFTPNLDKLQDKGYIERLPDPNDRRAVRIYLTDKARAEEEAIMRLASTLDGQIDARLPEGSLNCFHEIITVLQTVELD